MKNEIGITGIGFVEFSSANPVKLQELFKAFGFSKIKKHTSRNFEYHKQNDIHFFLNTEPNSFARGFADKHGPCISSMGWLFENPAKAHEMALAKGAKAAKGDYTYANGEPVLAIYGIGDSLIYFLDRKTVDGEFTDLGFGAHDNPFEQPDKGFQVIDHLTNNVENGTMGAWSDFYKNIFGFTEVKYFDIRGVQTGLTSYALRSPDGSFCIPINEAKESKSQINEYLEEYNGPGIQHLAFASDNIIDSLDKLKESRIEVLDIDDEYYADIFKKFPQVKENHEAIKNHQVLVDGDENGYLLQIFTKNLIGPIFIEIIQRENYALFGDGNFGALFRSIERDQMKRGYLK